MSENPYGNNPQQPPQPPQNPYGTGAGESPYGQPVSPPAQPSGPGQPPYGQQPYGQQPPPTQAPVGPNPYGAPYAQSPYGQQPVAGGPLGDGLDMYGRPLGRRVTDSRPGTVTAAGWTTLVVSGLMLLLFGFIAVAMIVAKDDVLTEIDKAIRDSGQSSTTFTAEDAFGLVVGIVLAIAFWCLIACVLAVFAMRRSRVSRVLLVISAVVAGLFSLLGIQSVVTVVPLFACIAVVVLLFTGGANEWYRDRY